MPFPRLTAFAATAAATTYTAHQIYRHSESLKSRVQKVVEEHFTQPLTPGSWKYVCIHGYQQ